MADTRHITIEREYTFFAACALAAALSACIEDPPCEAAPQPVVFSAAILTAAPVAASVTRTTDGGNSWTDTDRIGIFMLRAEGDTSDPADVLADNVEYIATPGNPARTASFAPVDATRTIYYPADGAAVDFTAYYPHSTFIDDKLQIDLKDQTTPQSLTDLDVLWAEAPGAAGGGPVEFTFNHVLSKITFNVTVGDGSAAGADVTGVTVSGNFHATLDPKTGSVVPSIPDEFPAVETATNVFTSLLVPNSGQYSTVFEVAFTVRGLDYIWVIPESETFEAGVHYIYPVTVDRFGIVVGPVTIGPWDGADDPENSGGSGTAEKAIDQPEANSYMVAPGSTPILIPISRANRAADQAHNLGASASGLGGVTEGNYTIELGWDETPVGLPRVIEEMAVQGDRVFVKPGATAGNAVILLKVNGQVKWSWHIWVTEETVSEKPDAGTGLIWMDRNLGAAYAAYSASGRNGMFYQWGRKDAFPTTGAVTTSETLTTMSALVQNPTVFATNSTTYTYQGSAGAVSWNDAQGNKTIYDPCPAGWRVPPIEIEKNRAWKNVWGAPGDWTDFSNYGRTFKGVDDALNHFYPAGGYRLNNTGEITNRGDGGYWWSSTPYNDTRGSSLYVVRGSTGVSPASSGSNSAGLTVRCIRDINTPPRHAPE
jgi:uncharacterized protein (TIGR02145 family)